MSVQPVMSMKYILTHMHRAYFTLVQPTPINQAAYFFHRVLCLQLKAYVIVGLLCFSEVKLVLLIFIQFVLHSLYLSITDTIALYCILYRLIGDMALGKNCSRIKYIYIFLLHVSLLGHAPRIVPPSRKLPFVHSVSFSNAYYKKTKHMALHIAVWQVGVERQFFQEDTEEVRH